jgi:hypothetical protein
MWAKEEQGNNVDYGETFVSTLFLSFNDSAWYFIYGVLVHLSHRREWLKNFEKIPLMKINLRDNSVQEIIGNLGKVMVILKVGETKIGVNFNNVFYCQFIIIIIIILCMN